MGMCSTKFVFYGAFKQKLSAPVCSTLLDDFGNEQTILQSHLYQGRMSGHAFFLLACIRPVMSS